MLLLPAGMFEAFPARQFELVLRHERCHLRRRDNATAALHMLVECVFWFHPLVWSIRARLLEERERACDEEVLGGRAERQLYAETLVNVCRTCVSSRLHHVPGLTGGNLTGRIVSIMAGQAAFCLSPVKRLLLAATLAVAIIIPLFTGLARGMDPSPAGSSEQDFEAVSIKQYAPKGPLSEGCTSRDDPVLISRTGCTLEELVGMSYSLKNYQVKVKAADWISTDRYVIRARLARPTRAPEVSRMLQGLLAERFRMRIHWEERQGIVYSLMRAGNALKLQPATNTTQCGRVDVREGSLRAECLTIDDFAEALQEYVVKDRPVVNLTDIDKQQRYRFDLEYSPSDDTATAPSVYSLLPARLGLVLKPARGPIRTLVVDAASRPQQN